LKIEELFTGIHIIGTKRKNSNLEGKKQSKKKNKAVRRKKRTEG